MTASHGGVPGTGREGIAESSTVHLCPPEQPTWSSETHLVTLVKPKEPGLIVLIWFHGIRFRVSGLRMTRSVSVASIEGTNPRRHALSTTSTNRIQMQNRTAGDALASGALLPQKVIANVRASHPMTKIVQVTRRAMETRRLWLW